MAISNFGFGGSNVHCILGGGAGRARASMAIAPAMEAASAEEAKEVSSDQSHPPRAVLCSHCSILCGQAICAGRAALTCVLGWEVYRGRNTAVLLSIYIILMLPRRCQCDTHACCDRLPHSTFGWRMTAFAIPDLRCSISALLSGRIVTALASSTACCCAAPRPCPGDPQRADHPCVGAHPRRRRGAAPVHQEPQRAC